MRGTGKEKNATLAGAFQSVIERERYLYFLFFKILTRSVLALGRMGSKPQGGLGWACRWNPAALHAASFFSSARFIFIFGVDTRALN